MKTASLRQFSWSGIDVKGFKVSGKLLAVDWQDAKNILAKRHITVLHIGRCLDLLGWLQVGRIKPADITAFSIEIATLITSGIALTQALHILATNTTHPPMKLLIQRLNQHVEGGNFLSSALKIQAKYFDALFYNLVHAGECSGTLDVVLQHIALHREKMTLLQQKIRKALFYPGVVLVVALAVTGAMLVLVMPQFERLFQTMGAELPLFTRWVLNISAGLQRYIGWGLSGIGVMVLSLRFMLRCFVKMQAWRDRVLFKIPLLGKVLLEAIFARCFRTLAMTLRSGLPLLESLRLTADIAGNSVYKHAFMRVSQSIQQGQSVQHSLQKTALFPARVIQMLSIGEESGRLDEMLEKLAQYYETQVDNKVQSLSQLLEPALMLFLCVVVGGLVIAMYLPIFRLGSII